MCIRDSYDGREVVNLASNNYLGLANHAKLIEAALAATRAFGVGSGAVRTIAGTMRIHMELEEKIASFKNVEACVVFQDVYKRQVEHLRPHWRDIHQMALLPEILLRDLHLHCLGGLSKSREQRRHGRCV